MALNRNRSLHDAAQSPCDGDLDERALVGIIRLGLLEDFLRSNLRCLLDGLFVRELSRNFLFAELRAKRYEREAGDHDLRIQANHPYEFHLRSSRNAAFAAHSGDAEETDFFSGS